ncbi:MAG: SDR family oxidoreductase [Actinomycetota bacterium]|nr:SDR family oxidoreductase [Actinomycetota bacterium]
MGKSVVITGANSGIGLVTALELAGGGYDVIGTARTKEKAAAITAAAGEKGLTVRTVLLDVTDAESTEKGFAEIAGMTDGGPWAVVNNAGFAQMGAVEDVDDDAARYQLEVNLLAPARIARLVLPGMRARGDGRIVNVSSVAGRLSAPLMGWYCASKHAVEALSDALRMEVADFGVKVILIEPGTFGTNIWSGGQDSVPEPSDPAYAAAYKRASAVTGRATSMPDPVWVARAIRLALASPVPLARYLVGVDAVGGVVAERLIPTVLTDLVKGVASGLRRLPTGLPGRDR